MSKRRRVKRPSGVVTTHDDDEGYVATPVQHIVSVAGTTSSSTLQVMVPVSPQKAPVMAHRHGLIPESYDTFSGGYDADADDGDLRTIHYIKAPRAKRYPNAVCMMC